MPVPKGKLPVSVTHPEYEEEYAFDLNDGVSFSEYTAGSDKKVWWRCKVDPTHLRFVSFKNITKGAKCRFCEGRSASSTNNLLVVHPEIAATFHPTRNAPLTAADFTPNSNKKVWWLCAAGHETYVTVNDRVRAHASGCRYCENQEGSPGNNLTVTHPEIAAQLHPTLNGDVKAENLTYGSSRTMWWQCPKYKDHVWDAMVFERTRGDGCSMCSGHRPSARYNLAYCYPELLKEIHPTKNPGFDPYQVTPGCSDTIWWQCSVDPSHEWQARIANRTAERASGCNQCMFRRRSKIEIQISAELRYLFPDLVSDHRIQTEEWRYAVDMYIPSERLVIEFDGSYFHAGKEDRDALKTRRLQDAGCRVIRIRESPLGLLGIHDVSVPTAAPEKQIVDILLPTVKSLLGYLPKRAHSYLRRNGLVNEALALEEIQSYLLAAA